MKSGKVVLVLSGKYAGRKAVIVKVGFYTELLSPVLLQFASCYSLLSPNFTVITTRNSVVPKGSQML